MLLLLKWKSCNFVRWGVKLVITHISRAYWRSTGGPDGFDLLWNSHNSIFHRNSRFWKVDSILKVFLMLLYFELNFRWMTALFIRASTHINHLLAKLGFNFSQMFTNSNLSMKDHSDGTFSALKWAPPRKWWGDNLRGNFEKIVVVTLYWTLARSLFMPWYLK